MRDLLPDGFQVVGGRGAKIAALRQVVAVFVANPSRIDRRS
jgi:hypothetical protein